MNGTLIARCLSLTSALALAPAQTLAAPPTAVRTADTAVVITNASLSVEGIKSEYAADEPVVIVVRPPTHGVVRAQTEVELFRGGLEGTVVVQEIKRYDKLSTVRTQHFSLLPAGDGRAGTYGLMVRVRGLRASATVEHEVESFEEKATYRLRFAAPKAEKVTHTDTPSKQRVTQTSGKTLEGVIHYGLNAYRLDAKGEAQVDRWAQALRALDNLGHVRVEGHTDHLGTQDRNLWTSRQRARRVRDRLIALSIPAKIITIVGHGIANPYVKRQPAPDEKGVWENRRVEITWFPKEGTPP